MSHIVTPREAAAGRERGRMNEYTRKPGRIGVFLVARIPALRPDVAVLDVRRPDGSGISVCRESAPRAVLPADQARHAAPPPKPPPSPHATPTTTTTTMTDPRLTTQDTDHPQGPPAPAQIPPHLNADRPGREPRRCPQGSRRLQPPRFAEACPPPPRP